MEMSGALIKVLPRQYGGNTQVLVCVGGVPMSSPLRVGLLAAMNSPRRVEHLAAMSSPRRVRLLARIY